MPNRVRIRPQAAMVVPGAALLLLVLAAGLIVALARTVAPVEAAPAAQGTTPADIAAQAVYLINQQRAAQGLLPLKYNANLRNAAQGHSQDMAQNNFFSHSGSNGSTFDARINSAGYTGWDRIAENIAAGYDSPQAAVAGWMASPAHRANILSGEPRETGMGYAPDPGDQRNVRLEDGSLGGPFYHYWTQDFGRRPGVYPVVINLEAPSTNSSQVTLSIWGQGWASEMRVSNSGDFAGAAWEPYASSRTWTLLPGGGPRTVYVQLRHDSGTVVTSADDIQANVVVVPPNFTPRARLYLPVLQH